MNGGMAMSSYKDYKNQVCVSKPIQSYPLHMKYGRDGMDNTQKSFGSTAGRKVKAWRGVLCCWHCGTSKMWEKW